MIGRSFVSVFFCVALSACGPLSGFEEDDDYPAPHQENDRWWRGIGPNERARRLIERARADADRQVGEQCKEWLRDVVIDASFGAANLPATCRLEKGEWRRARYGWYWCPSPYVTNISLQIQQARPGWIVQMFRKGNGVWNPHTAMVLSLERGVVWWIDSNAIGPERVGIHFETFGDFERSVCEAGTCYYSIYAIGD